MNQVLSNTCLSKLTCSTLKRASACACSTTLASSVDR
jgi:hypothetical protein